jgi:hypothetical protein
MSGIKTDTDNLRAFASTVHQLAQYFSPSGNAIPSNLQPDPGMRNPDIGQRLSTFQDAVNLYISYETYRSQLIGDPSQLTDPVPDPTASSLAAFVSGLQHLVSTANAIAKNYDSAQDEDHFGAAQVNALLNADPSTTGTGSGT